VPAVVDWAGAAEVAPAWQRAHGRRGMVDSSKDPGIRDPSSDTQRGDGEGETNAAQDLVGGLSMLMSAATKALSSLERRDDQRQGRSTVNGLSAEDLTELVDKSGRKILDLVSRVASELGSRGPAASRASSDGAGATGGDSDEAPHARGPQDQ
jgi:hypothetical protein